MKRLSSPLTQMKDHYQVVVIGSGYGGGIAASRLARAGQQVCVLERGKEIHPGDYPDTTAECLAETQVNTQDSHLGSRSGLYHYHVNEDMSVLTGCGLGGTSLINANVAIRPDGRVFADPRWPQALRDDVTTLLEAGFQRAEEMLRPTPYPEHFPALPKLQALGKSAAALGGDFYRLKLNVNFEEGVNPVGIPQPACTLCGDCMAGCNTGAKNTTLMNYLPDAHQYGAEIYTQVDVRTIERRNGRWVVHYLPLESDGEVFHAPPAFVSADIVVVAAGTMGTNEILLRSKAAGLSLSDQLGCHFSGNGDVGGAAYNADVVVNAVGRGPNADKRPPVGPTITGAIDLRDTPNLDDGLIIEEGAIFSPVAKELPGLLAGAAKVNGQDTDGGRRDESAEKLRQLESLVRGPYEGAVNHTQIFLVMAHDDSHGRLTLAADRLRITWPNGGRQPFMAGVNQRLKQATQAIGGTYLANPLWSQKWGMGGMITAHPLGGCVMAEDAQRGVVNHKGQVFAGNSGTAVHDGLYVCDAAVVPRSLGANPLLTISALAERTMMMLAQDRGWHIDYSFHPVAPFTAPQPEVLGVQFTETMKGYFSTAVRSDFQAGWERGQADGSSFQFIVTIRIEDMERFMESPEYTSGVTGIVTAPALSPQPLVITEGCFNLAVADPHDPARLRRMIYRLKLSAVDGHTYYFDGFKLIRDDAGLDLWPDTTTLYITVFEGTDESGAVVGKGILRITADDFARQISTLTILNARSKRQRLEATAHFGRYFGGVLFDIYGGIFARATGFDPEAPPRQKRPLRTAAPDVHFFHTADGLRLRLTRYQGGPKGPVMLVHGLGVSSLAFAIDTIDTNLTEYLYAQGYDVWLLDYRSSIELPYADTQYTADDIANYDWPAAVQTVRALTGAEAVDVIVHCYGAITFMMAMLAGLDGVRSAVCSQVGAHLNVISANKIRSGLYLDKFLETIQVDNLTMYTDRHDNWLDQLYNRALRLYPVTEREEQCNNPVCYRISFLYAPLYEHDQLNNATHAALHELFGIASISNFRHLGELTRAGRLVAADGQDSYMPHVARLAIPITFIHGAENQTWTPDSTARTCTWLAAHNDPSLYRRHIIEKYGHIDCIFGRNAAQDVYPLMLAHLEKVGAS
ncbi:MAG: GMC family oxidoreductase N-terminal domain-containing protein [Anaerolineae bacterium]|nr:GMC family oxidoreductase N-terminal domain-containing protein [Anaerolineae bacterium]